MEVKNTITDGTNHFFEGDIVSVSLRDGGFETGRIANIGNESIRLDTSTPYNASTPELAVSNISFIVKARENVWD